MNEENINYIISRLAQVPIVLFLLSIIVFMLIHIPPGDPAQVLLGPYAPPESIEAFREAHNLDEPLHMQYLLWLQGVLTGSLGKSITSTRPVFDLIAGRLPVTITLMTTSLIVAVSIALPAGYISAVNQYEWKDHVATVFAFLGLSIPNFFLAILLIKFLAVEFNVLPISPSTNLFQDPVETAKVFIMPSLALGTALSAQTTRLLRSSMLEVFSQEYVRVARAKGLSKRAVNRYIVFRNALIPVITIVALQAGFLLGGTVVIEQVFALPGIGRLMFSSVTSNDFPVVQALVLFFGTMFIIINLVADILYVFIDPRIQYGGDVNE